MPAAAFAVSGHARAVSLWLNLVERLVVGADDQLAAAWHPSRRPGAGGVGPRLGRAVWGPSWAAPTVTPPKRRWPPARSPIQRHWAKPTCS